MKKKFYISLLTLLFFLSTTSLPISIHLCEMAESAGVEECNMCKIKQQKKSCCSDDIFSSDVKIKKSSSGSCCSTQLVDVKVKDNFLSTKTEIQNLTLTKVLSSVIFDNNVDLFTKIISYSDKDTSPPSLQTNNLYLLNNIFLI